ncbi:MAG: hypothetical protein ACI4AB_07395 [Acetatifactor sp.]
MKLIIHDLGEEYNEYLNEKADKVIWANGKYAPCQGCFHCWTKNPATCDMKDSLHEMCRIIGQADDLIIITENWYGGHSPAIKNILDRSIGTSTPFSTYRGRQMHHTLRYGKHNKMTVVAYGDMTDRERETWKLMVERNAINEGFVNHELICIDSKEEAEGIAL